MLFFEEKTLAMLRSEGEEQRGRCGRDAGSGGQASWCMWEGATVLRRARKEAAIETKMRKEREGQTREGVNVRLQADRETNSANAPNA